MEEEVTGTGWWQCARGAETVWDSPLETDADEKDASELVQFFLT